MTQKLVDQPTKAPTRKVTFSGIAGSIAYIAVEMLQQVPALQDYSSEWWAQVGAVIAFGITYYHTHNRGPVAGSAS